MHLSTICPSLTRPPIVPFAHAHVRVDPCAMLEMSGALPRSGLFVPLLKIEEPVFSLVLRPIPRRDLFFVSPSAGCGKQTQTQLLLSFRNRYFVAFDHLSSSRETLEVMPPIDSKKAKAHERDGETNARSTRLDHERHFD